MRTPEEIAMLEEIAAAALTVAETLAHLVDDADALPDPARLALWALMFAAAPLALEDPEPAWVAPANLRVGQRLNDGFAKERKPRNARKRR